MRIEQRSRHIPAPRVAVFEIDAALTVPDGPERLVVAAPTWAFRVAVQEAGRFGNVEFADGERLRFWIDLAKRVVHEIAAAEFFEKAADGFYGGGAILPADQNAGVIGDD